MSKGWTEVLRKVWVSLLRLEAPRGFCIVGHALIPSLKGPTLWGTSGHRPQALVWSPCWQEGRVVRWQPATLLLRVLATSPLPLALGLAPSLRDVPQSPDCLWGRELAARSTLQVSTSWDIPPVLWSHHPGEDTASGKARARCLVLVLTWCPGIGRGHTWSPEGCGFPARPGHLAQNLLLGADASFFIP